MDKGNRGRALAVTQPSSPAWLGSQGSYSIGWEPTPSQGYDHFQHPHVAGHRSFLGYLEFSNTCLALAARSARRRWSLGFSPSLSSSRRGADRFRRDYRYARYPPAGQSSRWLRRPKPYTCRPERGVVHVDGMCGKKARAEGAPAALATSLHAILWLRLRDA
jgi:hypothetical protein